MSGHPRLGRVMTVDDEKVDQMLYQRILRRSGLVEEVIPFRMAPEALAYLRQPDRPAVDVILLDVNMPQMSGLAFLEQAVAEFGPGFVRGVVIMLTTSLNPEDRARALRFEVVRDCLEKPLRAEHLPRIAQAMQGARRAVSTSTAM